MDHKLADGTTEASYAEEDAERLRRLAEDGKLGPDGLAIAYGARAVTYALLALRETVAAAGDDLGGAIADAGAEIADAGAEIGGLTDLFAGLGGGQEPAAALQDLPDYVLHWEPVWGPGGHWYLLPARPGLEPPRVWPLLEDRGVDAGQVAAYAGLLLGYEAAVTRSRRLAGRLWPPRLAIVSEWEVRPAWGRCDAAAGTR
jgi:hypothetical protein